MNYNEMMRKTKEFDRMDGEDYGERGSYGNGNYGGRGGYGERGDYEKLEKAICKGIEHGMKKAFEYMEEEGDDEYGERRGVRGTGRYSRVRRGY